ncbi:MAG: type II toxin-antitoxin system mRNA interferase toxin, RelE/StbE family [Patescibacteria group bacterium]
MLKVKTTGLFERRLENIFETDWDLGILVQEKISLFRKNPEDTRLRNHKLKRRLVGKFAFSITDDVRVVYELESKNVVRFLDIGTHMQVYTKKN